MSTVSSKLPLQCLPLPPKSHILTRNLTPDPLTPGPPTFHGSVLQTKPSVQRRARLLDEAAHYSHVSPLPLAFPYRIEVDENSEDSDRSKAVETWLAQREALNEVDLGPSVLKGYSSDQRIKEYHLIGVAPRGLKECLPALDVGDAFEHIGIPALIANSEEMLPTSLPSRNASNEKDPSSSNSVSPARTRQVLTDILGGHTVLFGSSKETGYAPWSLRYSGHQFGAWAGQLGDGRAISILESPHPNDPNLIYELQLKGAGRTPFSRTADGLAVLRSSVREYLGAEAMNALGVPTTRSLAMVLYPTLPVRREDPTPEKATVVTRVAPSFIRIGNFESLNPPTNAYAFSFIGQQRAQWDGLRILGEWVSRRVLQLNLGPGKDDKPPAWGKELVLECARRNARMVAHWQAYGFMHGVINTDNVSILGLTIDYGPYAFMDVFDENHICNHTDEEGRYSYKYQPTMIIYAIRALLTSLSPLIGAELELGHAVSAGWADEVSKDRLDNWREDGMELKQEIEETVMDTFNTAYWPLMRKRLALRRELDSDSSGLIHPLLKLLEVHQLDYHSTFRTLCSFRPSFSAAELESFATRLTPESLVTSTDARERAKKDWVEWLETYKKRINEEQDDWNGQENWMVIRQQEGYKANPRFVLRQWVLEEVIKKVEENHVSGKRILAKVLEMASNPFEPWGAENNAGPEAFDEEIREEQRYCGMGPSKLLGFQCSCSS
ncbi:hypothetical protein JB92DRAFT_2695654 [Gautieria morchelliformis]|nr:hypothetical protein JB92DRAFT_2695654 [Gautieria morchelliformis]